VIPSLFPVFDFAKCKLRDGGVISACSFCKKSILSKQECKSHYAALSLRPEGYSQCPFGFTTRTFHFGGQMWAITGIIAFPRFGTDNEREMAKKHPDTRVARDEIELHRKMLSDLELLRVDAVQEAAQVFPQAFHELRKLNGAIIQHAEKEMTANGSSPALITIKSAAELMRNNFDILEALSNIDGMRALPADSTISLYDLAYKTQRVLMERANVKGILLALTGVRAIIRGSQKSFPIVPAVLIENAIKYGKAKSTVSTIISASGKAAVLTVENFSDYPIDITKCFDRGSRYANNAAEGAGIGLFLAKEIVLAHKGKIHCESANGKVSMIVQLPLEKVA
jgi:two-component system, OmpR family, heavy metal sensor histidine kinase CusS